MDPSSTQPASYGTRHTFLLAGRAQAPNPGCQPPALITVSSSSHLPGWTVPILASPAPSQAEQTWTLCPQPGPSWDRLPRVPACAFRSLLPEGHRNDPGRALGEPQPGGEESEALVGTPDVHRGCETLSVFEELSKGQLTRSSPHSWGTMMFPTLPSRRLRLTEAESHIAFTAESGSELRPSGSRVHHGNHLAPVGSVELTSVHLSALPVAGTGPSWGSAPAVFVEWRTVGPVCSLWITLQITRASPWGRGGG